MVSLKHLVDGIQCIIPGGISIQDLAAVINADNTTSEKVLSELERQGIGERKNDIFYFDKGDKLKSAILAISKGAQLEDVSIHLDWRDFEGLVAEILESKNFAIIRNLILKKPRMEIDVVGIRLGVAMLIDCKHWQRVDSSSLRDIVEKQIRRTKHYVAQTRGAMAVPVIVTLYDDKIDFIQRVPIVSISKFSSFVDEFFGNLDKMEPIAPS